MKQNNKFHKGEIVVLSLTGEHVTIQNFSYVTHMKKFSYTIKENPKTFYFENELVKL